MVSAISGYRILGAKRFVNLAYQLSLVALILLIFISSPSREERAIACLTIVPLPDFSDPSM
jgi:hypothetical protein